jgi:hypothetical protein
MADITDAGISCKFIIVIFFFFFYFLEDDPKAYRKKYNKFAVVEDLFKRREPMTSMDAIYFLQPLKEKYIFFFYFFLSVFQ